MTIRENQQYPCVETTVDFDYKYFEFRLWLGQETTQWNVYVPLVIQKIKECVDKAHEYETNFENLHVEDFIEAITDLIPNLNAIQVRFQLHEYKQGIMVYCVDF